MIVHTSVARDAVIIVAALSYYFVSFDFVKFLFLFVCFLETLLFLSDTEIKNKCFVLEIQSEFSFFFSFFFQRSLLLFLLMLLNIFLFCLFVCFSAFGFIFQFQILHLDKIGKCFFGEIQSVVFLLFCCPFCFCLGFFR